MLIGSGIILATGEGTGQLFWQFGIIFSDYYGLFGLIGNTIITVGILVFVYFWEKHLTSFHFVPTIIVIITLGLFTLPFGYYIMNGENWVLFDTIATIGTLLSFVSFLFLLAQYMRRVKGNLRRSAIFLFIGIITNIMATFLDNELTYEMIPGLTSWVSVSIFIASLPIILLGIRGTIDGLHAYQKQSTVCVIHRGPIQAPAPIFYCTSCFVPYCEACYNSVVQKEGCWNCHEGKPELVVERQVKHAGDDDSIPTENERDEMKPKKDLKK